MSDIYLLSEIHSQRNTGFLATGYLDRIKDSISGSAALGTGYYQNHIGREISRRLYNLNLTGYIYDSYDAGFRPLTVTGILAAGSSSSPSSVSQIENVFGEYIFAPTASQELYFDFGSTISTTI